MQLTLADIVYICYILQPMMTWLYVESYIGQVFVLASQHLVCPAAGDDFVKLLYFLQNCVMHLKKN